MGFGLVFTQHTQTRLSCSSAAGGFDAAVVYLHCCVSSVNVAEHNSCSMHTYHKKEKEILRFAA